MIATTRDQSTRLLKCGVSADTADMTWHNSSVKGWELFAQGYKGFKESDIPESFAPAWSLSRLIDFIFSFLDSQEGSTCHLAKAIKGSDYILNIFNMKGDIKVFIDKTAIACAVKSIEWLTSNGYKLNEIK